MPLPTQAQLIHFIDRELDIPQDSLAIAIKQTEAYCGSLPMVLWQYGLINLHQLEKIFTWIESL